MTRAEKKARKAIHAARRVVAAHDALEQQAVQTIDGLVRRCEELEEVQARFRAVLFGSMMARGLEAEGFGMEPKMSEALLQAWPEWFRGKEAAPWMAFSQ